MSYIPIPDKDYSDGRTKQSFKESCDINNILRRAQRAGALSHIQQFGGEYADFSDFDFLEAHIKLARAKEIFDHLPHTVKSEFHQSPAAFFEFANNPDNRDRLSELFPVLANPGVQLPVIGDLVPAPEPVPGGTEPTQEPATPK